jgi:uncharacterized protein YbjT (DUF2867 family)
MASAFLTGATGYMGRRLAAELLSRGHRVRGLTRPGSEGRLPPGCDVVAGDALDAATYREKVIGRDTLVHLVGVARPSPAKAAEFRSVDLASATQAIGAALAAGVRHFIYLSVAHPAPVMRAYIEARMKAENAIRISGLNATILRPWYVLGPGHRWPYALVPVYWAMGAFPSTRDSSRRLGLVTLKQMVDTLTYAVEHPVTGVRVVEVPEIRAGRF